MIFLTYKKWEDFCKFLKDNNIFSKRIDELFSEDNRFLSLKHDVETDVKKALKVAEIEAKFNQKSTYYVQGYLLEKKENIEILKKIQNLGHEVSYHYDVLDFAKGDFKKAQEEFDRNLKLFLDNGFKIKTLCQHGNPLVDRKGYTSNRDFFRNKNIQKKYKMYDVMVNLRENLQVKNYIYVSDYGFSLSIVKNPETADIKSETEKIDFEKLKEIILKNSVIFSSHPHRFYNNLFEAYFRYYTFNFIKKGAKIAVKIPFVKKIIYKNYHLAKRF